MKKSWLGAVLLAGTLSACATYTGETVDAPTTATEPDAAPEEHWTHAEADAWGGTCASGTQQSPVDLTGADPEDLADIEFDYRPSEVLVANTGHTIQVGLDEPGSTIEVDGERFELGQFHFHSPSEHTVDGEHAAAELHLVHQDADANLAVIGVLIEEGAANDALAPVLTDVPDQPGAEMRPAARIDAAGLLPESLLTFRYDGSLTTPPCSEGVRWMVMAEPVTWSAEQLAAFTELYDDSNRPVQPLGDRVEVIDTTE